jgi:SWIM/SEC-C metal-binding protein
MLCNQIPMTVWRLRVAKLGTHKRPAIVRLATQERAEQVLELCQQCGIQVIIGVEPDQEEDISDIERILRRQPTLTTPKAPPRISGNDYCPCRSGKKYKKCCALSTPAI